MHCNSWNFQPTEEVKIKKFIPSISSLLTILKSKINFDRLALNRTNSLLITMLMIMPTSVIQAQDKTIDGIKFRYSTVLSQDQFKIDDYEIAKY